jgi:hypothetical protein
MENLGWVLFGLHEFIFVLFLVVFVVRPGLRPILIAMFIPVFLFHVSGYGCPFTRIERHFHGQNVTIMDPMLNIVGLPITRDNRESFQGYFSSLLLFVMVLTVWIYPSK